MSNTVNAEVVETRDFKLTAFWKVRYLEGASQRVSWEFDSLEDAQSFVRDHLKRTTKYQIIRIPAEGEEQPKREPATSANVNDEWHNSARDVYWQAFLRGWRAAERNHGITGDTK